MILYAHDLATVHARVSTPAGGDVVRYGDAVYRRVGVRVRGAREEPVYRQQAPPPRPRTLLSTPPRVPTTTRLH